MPDDLWGPDVPEDRDPGWKRRLLGAQPSEVLARELPTVRYINVRVTLELARLASGIAKTKGLSREAWFRQILAEAVSAETPGLTREDVEAAMSPGRRTTKPETRRVRA